MVKIFKMSDPGLLTYYLGIEVKDRGSNTFLGKGNGKKLCRVSVGLLVVPGIGSVENVKDRID